MCSLEGFSRHISSDCCNLGPSNVAKQSRFGNEEEIWLALLHAMKCKLLCELRAQSVCHDDVLRLKVHDEDLGCASVVCRMVSFVNNSGMWRSPSNNEFSTDKHRMMWAINSEELSHLGLGKSASSSAPPRDYRTMSTSLTPETLEAAYRHGTLHVVQAAPHREYSTRITLEPKVDKFGDYLSVLLHWVGNIAYCQHAEGVEIHSDPDTSAPARRAMVPAEATRQR